MHGAGSPLQLRGQNQDSARELSRTQVPTQACEAAAPVCSGEAHPWRGTALPQLGTACSRLRLKQRVPGSGNRTGIWGGHFSSMTAPRYCKSLSFELSQRIIQPVLRRHAFPKRTRHRAYRPATPPPDRATWDDGRIEGDSEAGRTEASKNELRM